MDKIKLNLKTDNENSILPFLNVQIKDAKLPMDISIRRSKNIINRETSKLVDEFQLLNFQNNLRGQNASRSSINLKENPELKKFRRIQTNNNIYTSENNLFLKKQIINMKSSGNNIPRYRLIKNIKLSSGRDKYISLIKKYKDIDDKNKSLSESKVNSSKILKQNNSNSNLKIDSSQINNTSSISNTLKTYNNNISKKQINKTFSKINTLEKTLKDTQKNSMKIIKKIKRYKILSKKENENITDIIQHKEESIKKIQDLIDNENLKKNRITRINYNKILGPLHKEKDNLLKKMDLNQKAKRQIWLKESTVNLIKFGQYFNLMDDEQFFRQRKKIIKKFADIEKESDIIDGIQTERINKTNLGKGIKKNNQIIKQIVENNFDFYKNVSKKFECK